MKLLGFEIKRKSLQTHAEVVETAPSTQITQESRPVKKSTLRAELGDSGARNTRGYIIEDYNSQLGGGVNSIRIYDEMRKGDGTVRGAMLVTTLPIIRAKWFVNPVTQETKDIEIAQLVENVLFNWLDTSWPDVIRQALLMLPFGVMVFEKVYGTTEYDGKTYVHIKKLAPRLPKSIQRWELSDGTFGIQQIRQDGVMAEIPGNKLLIFVNEKEGDNWWGTSMLRAAYKHWYYKNNFYKIDSAAFERQGMGVPMIKMPEGYTEDEMLKAQTLLANLRANESSYLILPPKYEAEFMKMSAGDTRDPKNSIEHHNKEILQSVLAQFLELGQTSSSGSRALSEDQSDLFLKAMESIATSIIGEINKNLIPELVNMNFDGVTVYPKLDFSGISRKDVKALSESYNILVGAKAINPTTSDEAYLRALLGLPELEETDKTNDEVDNLDIDDPDGKEKEDEEDDMEDKKDMEPDEEDDDKEEDTKNGKEMKAHEHKKKVRKFDDGKGNKWWRKLTFAEQKVEFKSIEDKMNALQAEFEKEATELLNNAKDSFIAKLQTALEDEDKKAVSALEIKFVNDYKKLIKDFMKKAYEYGKDNASNEIGIDTPANTASTLANIDLIADTIAWKAASDIEAKAKISTVNGLKKMDDDLLFKKKKIQRHASIIQVVGMIDALIEETTAKVVSAAAGLIINQAINMGRKDVFERNKNDIQSFQRSEILDEVTCDFCLSMDGRVVGPDDDWVNEDTFHNNCRGIWVATLKDEVDPPEIEGIPDNLADYYGGEPNALIQPPRPIISPNSPAKDEVEKRQAEKKKTKKK